MHRPSSASRIAGVALTSLTLFAVLVLATPGFVQMTPTPGEIVTVETIEEQAYRIDRMYGNALDELERSAGKLEIALKQELEKREAIAKRRADSARAVRGSAHPSSDHPRATTSGLQFQPTPVTPLPTPPGATGIIPFFFGVED